MTTYQEITTSEKANYDYWTEKAKFALAQYRYFKELQESGMVKCYKALFKKYMQYRRDQFFYK